MRIPAPFRIVSSLGGDFDLYFAGYHAAQRDMHMARARHMEERGLRKLFVDFARDAHREHLRHLRQIKAPI